MSRIMVSVHNRTAELGRRLQEEDGFQTAEAIGIAAVGIVVLSGIMVLLEALGVDIIDWLRDRFGVGS
ncbi:MAG: hypothetical protein GY720_17205 [bacterium]|nr:hypothetical protein [bacterium]